eukprot:TRINITY_DN15112_c0_g1_i1.p1 TRINITY_DN15112_c0_g1~~TRINITY_DN15112_c0_g1_i1.p1  ORF type:complete len:380 (-),score=65.23 TRINITY_DN15112_c0_g1_i1:86-1225(-)
MNNTSLAQLCINTAIKEINKVVSSIVVNNSYYFTVDNSKMDSCCINQTVLVGGGKLDGIGGPPGLEECKVEDNVTIIIDKKNHRKRNGKSACGKKGIIIETQPPGLKRQKLNSEAQLVKLWKENPQLRNKLANFLTGSSAARLMPSLNEDMQQLISKKCRQKSLISDKQIYDELWGLINNYKKNQCQSQSITHAFDQDTWKQRSSSRVKQLVNLLPRGFKPTSILDIGCSEGSITSSVGKYFNLPPNQVFGCDVHQCSASTSDYTFNLINESDCKLPYANESMSLVMAFVSLHHVKELPKMLTEIKRVLKPRGYFVIREHDCDSNDEFATFLDVVHGMYATVLSEPREMTGTEFKECFHAHYRTRRELESLQVQDTFAS